jgi:hypothetical protein
MDFCSPQFLKELHISLKQNKKSGLRIKFFYAIGLSVICLHTWAQSAPDLLPADNKMLDTAKQMDMLDVYKKVFKKNPPEKIPDTGKRFYFTLSPLSNTPASSGNALVTSTTAYMYLGPKATTYKSSVNFAPYFDFHGRFGLPLRSSIWLKDDAWNIVGDIRFLIYPQYTWGLGNDHPNDHKALVNYSYIRFYQAALKKITSHIYVGGGYDLDYHANIFSPDSGVNLEKFTGYPYGLSGNSVSSGLTLNLLYDTRNRNVYPIPGGFLNIVYRFNPVFLGNKLTWQSFFVDARKYILLNPSSKPNQQNNLAIWSFYWTTFNNGVPYLDLPSTGWDEYNRSARGFDQNRYRGKSLYYLETEYRRDITNSGLIGFVVFCNINTVSGSGNMFLSWHPAGGMGLRLKLSKVSNSNFALDYAFSKGFQTVLFNFSETF